MKDKLRAETRAADKISVNNNADAETSLIENEIEQLKAQFSESGTSNETSWNSSVLRVLFKNEAFARKYKVKIEKFLKELLEEGEEFIVYHPSHNVEQEYEDNHQTFHIDKMTSNEFQAGTDADVPHYSSSYEDTLNCDDNSKVTEKAEEEKPSMMTCFNCLGNHHMKKCPEKLDRSRINANKKEVLAGNTIRYHTEEQNNSLKPGILSEELRNALGLQKNQLPKFIYHMRVIGYPPGWMDEAVFEESGLTLYDDHGKVISNCSSSSSSERGTLYDGTKFIDFPGFNSPVPEGYLDEWQTLKMPPLQSHQQLKEALKSPNITISSNVCKRKQTTADDDKDSKKSKNVEEKSSRSPPHQVYENDFASPQQLESKFDYNTPECNRSNKRHSMSISMSPGTPILKQGNPYQRLPDADKFAQGITEHLPFENLPDAVGTFEKMRGVISDVQKKLNTIKNS